jgi:hypothetical protein
MLEFELVTHDRTVTPQLFSWAVRAAVKFPLHELITLGVRLTDNPRTRRRGTTTRTADEIRRTIRYLRNIRDQTLAYQDYRGYSFTNVRILPGLSENENEDVRAAKDSTLLSIRVLNVSEYSLTGFIVESSLVGGPDVVVPGGAH